MADESEKKTECVLHKKEKTLDASPKKKVVVIKRKTAQVSPSSAVATEQKKVPVKKVVVKKQSENGKPEELSAAADICT